METPRAADSVPMKFRKDFDKNNGALYVANLENITTKEVLKKIKVVFLIVDMEITELQVDFNTTSAILDDTEDDLRAIKTDLHAAQKKINHVKSEQMWEKFFNGLEGEDGKQEVTDAKQEAVDARQEAADARQ
jgi:predicted  nucleic acid-binding Zn-ribbon protein